MASEAEAAPSFTSFPSSWHVELGQQNETESALLALPKLFKSFFTSNSSSTADENNPEPETSTSQRSSLRSEDVSAQQVATDGAAVSKRSNYGKDKEVKATDAAPGLPFPTQLQQGTHSRSALPDVPEHGEAVHSTKFPKRPARPTRLSVLGRTGPSVGLNASNATAAQHEDLAASQSSLASHYQKNTDNASLYTGSPSVLFDPAASQGRASVTRPTAPLADDTQSIMSFSTSPAGAGASLGASGGRGHKPSNSDALENIVRVVRKMRGAGITMDYWMADESTTQCFDCQLPFTAFRRKHHCRLCGQIFCSSCASNIMKADRYGSRGHLRICNGCFALAERWKPASSAGPATAAAPSSRGALSELQHPHQADPPSTPASRFLTGLGLDEDSLSLKSKPPAAAKRPQISAPLESHIRPPQSQFAAATLFPRAEFPAHVADHNDDHDELSRPQTPDFDVSPKFFSSVTPDLDRALPLPETPGFPPNAGQYAPFRKPASPHEEQGLPVSLDEIQDAAARSRMPSPTQLQNAAALQASRAASPKIPFPSLSRDENSKTEPLPPTLVPSSSASHSNHTTDGLGITIGPPAASSHETMFDTAESLAAKQADIGPRTGPPGVQTSLPSSSASQQQEPPATPQAEIPSRPNTPSSGSGHPSGSAAPSRPSYFYRTRSRVSSLTTDPSDELSGSGAGLGTPRSRKDSLAMIENEVTSINLQFVKRLLGQLLLQTDLNPDVWQDTLMHLLVQVTKTVRTIPRAENIDVSRHVKLKKLPGGKPKNSEYVDGIVFTKNLLRKQMPRERKRPRIMLLSYPVEYQRQDQLMSLAPIIHQEEAYLSALVARITALRPHIVLVDQAVSGRAVDLLTKAGIAVARNVKSSVMHTLSRAFQTEIISSLDQLSLRPSLGRCDRFQVQTFVHQLLPAKRKTFLRFEGTNRDAVCTLILRGGDQDTLARVKNVMRFMVEVAFNLRMESFLFYDEHVSVLSPPAFTYQLPADADYHDPTSPSETEAKAAQREMSQTITDELQPYLDRILSNTPFTVFPPPYPLLRMKLEDANLHHLRYLYHQEEAARILQEEIESRRSDATPGSSLSTVRGDTESTLAVPESGFFQVGGNALSRSVSQQSFDSLPGLPPSRPFDQTYAALALSSAMPKVPEVSSLSAQLERAQDQHSVRYQRFTQFLATTKPISDPRKHQEIIVLTSTFHSATLKPCKIPELVRMKFYSPSDQTLGAFLEGYVDQVAVPCSSPTCGQTALVHYKVFVHGQRRVTCVLEQFPCPVPGGQDRIYMWSYCKICQAPAKHTVMNEQTWQYSFAKYLEQSFYGGDLGCRTIYPNCTHNVHQDHVRYFALRNLAVRIYSDPIEVLDVCPPPMQIKVHEDVRSRLRADEMRSMATRFETFWASLNQRLQCLNFDACSPELVDEAHKAVDGFHQRFGFEKQQISRMLFETHRDSTSSSGLAFTAVKRAMQEKVVEWDATFASFEQKFLPTERDLRRLTGSQLKKLFDHTTGVSTTDSRLTSPSLAPTLEEGDTSEDGADTRSLLSIPELPGSMPLSAANLEAIDLKLGDLPVGTPSSSSSFSRSLSAPSLQRASQQPAEATTSGLPRIIQELSESGSDSDSTVCADSTNAVLPSNDKDVKATPEGAAKQQSDQLEETTAAARSKDDTLVRPDNRGVAKLVRQFDLSPPASRPQSPKFRKGGEGDIQRPVFRRGYSDYTRAMARSKKHSGTITDPESAPVSRPRSPDLYPAFARNSSTQRLKKEKPLLIRSGSGRSSGSQGEGSSKQSTVKKVAKSRPASPAGKSGSDSSQALRPTKVTTSASKGATAASKTLRDASKGPPPTRGGDRTAAVKAAGQRRIASTGTRVSTLARHFDRMSRDAERERNKKLAAMRGKRARPVGVSKAVVEVFANAREALREDSDAEDDRDVEEAGADDELEDPDYAPLPKGARRQSKGKGRVDSPTKEPISAPFKGPLIQKQDYSRQNSPERPSDLRPEDSNQPPPPVLGTSLPTSPSSNSHAFPPDISKAHQQSESELSSSGTEKSSILKTISSLWGARSCDFVPLAYPLKPTEHLVANNPVLVREDEPSSLLAYALASEDYRERILQFNQEPKVSERTEAFMPADDETMLGHGQENVSTWGIVDLPDMSGPEVGGDPYKRVPTEAEPQTEHFGLQFDAGGYKFSCKVFFAPQFAQVRQNCIDPEDFVESLARCVKWNTSGGKSGSAFLKTRDDRFVVKEISRLELEAFLHFAMEYFSHITQSFTNGVPTLMAKILGLFRVSFVSNGKSQRMDLLVMENLFYDRNVSRIYDLKGSKRNRHVVTTGKRGEVLLDENLTEVAYKSPLFVRELAKRDLRMALYNDTIWFSKHNIMDYSLIVGVDQERDELVVGIVDFIRTYTWDKKLESWVKGARNEPTIITPKLYKNRLRGACEEYFVLAPDHWTTGAQTFSQNVHKV